MPEPVTPSSTWSRSPASIPAARSRIAVGLVAVRLEVRHHAQPLGHRLGRLLLRHEKNGGGTAQNLGHRDISCTRGDGAGGREIPATGRLGGDAKAGKEKSSFSEEKEAKRLHSFGAEAVQPHESKRIKVF
ncbi:MAG: hypothetical protein QM753_11250 [Thermomicrobiales bacterium]